ncbi:hypothetical protein LMG18090_04051 [Ralstonia mannitolilytica]|uniref:hypothetical protein n=1 Tax=Ralstonia mannitolilytica TaxID=105219 RepID=UPI0028F552B4|nr:hypothetical protein [Ralstonia mannitolilytica]CAJ0800822.1 hypothetical protein LMG18090_04051 [Ralstonia mannitolilytica]
MKIPTGDFGNVVAKPQQAPQYSSAGAEALASGANRLAAGGMQLAEGLQAADDHRQRVQAVGTLANLTNDYHDVHDEVARGVADGSISTADAQATYKKRITDVTAARTQGLTPEQRQTIDSHLTTLGGTLARNLNTVILKRTQSETSAQLDDIGEALQRQAMRDLPTAVDQYSRTVDTMGPAAGWSPEKIALTKQKFKEGATYNFANATLEGAAQTGDLSMVRGAREKIQGPDGENIDPAKRTVLITKAYAYENGILAQQQRDADKAAREQQARENAATDAYNSAFDLMSKGRYMSQDFINDLAQKTAGTQMAGPTQELVKSQAQVAGFASLSLPQQAAVLERGNAAGSDPSVGVSPTEQKVQEQLKRIHDESVKAYKENPWQAAQERGVIQDAPRLTMNSVQDAQAVLSQRMRDIGVVEVAAGSKVSPLQPDEAAQIGKLVRALPPDQQSSALAAFGQIVGDPDRLAQLAKQFGDKDSILGIAMSYANAKTTQGRYTSELILRGERALKDNAITIDSHKETGWKGEIAKTIGDSIPDQTLDRAAKQAAYLIMAGVAAGGDTPDVKRAVGMAIGNILDQRDGSKVPMPYGMKEDTFRSRIKAITPADLAAQGAVGGSVFVGKQAVPLETFVKQLPDASLMHAGQGRYAVKAGSGIVTLSPGGQPLIIRVPQ